MNLIFRNRSFLLYGFSLATLLVLLRWIEWRFIFTDHSMELYTAAIAIVFTALGIWLALKLVEPKKETVIIEKTIIKERTASELDLEQLDKTGLSKRELEVLELMAGGLSNEEIAGKLFVSLSTVKTHSSNIFVKLDVKRRTQAVEKAKRLNIIH